MHNQFFTDTHCHIHSDENNKINDFTTVQNIIDEALKVNVKRLVTIGTTVNDSENAAKIANNFENIYAFVGIHPLDAENFKEGNIDIISTLAKNDKIIGIGEIGIDLHYAETSNIKLQTHVFKEMLSISKTLKKPVSIHCRDANEICTEILDSELGGGISNSGIIHCFNGNDVLLNWALDNNFYISFAGNITYKSAQDLRDALKKVPLDRLFIETDSPYLAPIPVRGKPNSPANVVHTAQFIANELDITMQELAEQLESNFQNFMNF